MFQLTPPTPPSHDAARFWLDVADKLIKLAAVFIGGLWTWWNYRKSRTYEQKLELEVVGEVFFQGALYGDVKVVAKNIGATKHTMQQVGTYCVVSIILSDLEEEVIDVHPVFASSKKIEPGESIQDTILWTLPQLSKHVIWIKLSLRVVSNSVEWSSSYTIRVPESAGTASDS